jgi:uncharacterized membrane protein
VGPCGSPASVFSLPFIANRDVDVITAVVSSINAVLRNRRTMLLWAVLVAALTFVGFMTAMTGFIVIIPWLGYATWHGYREALDVSIPWLGYATWHGYREALDVREWDTLPLLR